MAQLENLKNIWKNQEEEKIKFSKDDIFKMMHQKSSSVVKWILALSILEFLLPLPNIFLFFSGQKSDSGFIEKYDHNESIGARMAQEILPKYGYTDQHVKTIVELIHATEIPHKPINKLQEIICDADLDYLGRDDFEMIADNLRRELTEMGKIGSRKEWDQIQVKFLNQHQYFTQTALQSRQKKKAENLQVVVDRLAADAYQD